MGEDVQPMTTQDIASCAQRYGDGRASAGDVWECTAQICTRLDAVITLLSQMRATLSPHRDPAGHDRTPETGAIGQGGDDSDIKSEEMK